MVANGKLATFKDKAYQPAPPTHHYEFGGPLGAVGVSVAVPFFCYWLAFACQPDACPRWPLADFLAWHKLGWSNLTSNPDWWKSLWSWEATAVYVAWYAFCVVCWAILPGKMVEGQEMRNGKKLTYKMNACATFFASFAVVAALSYVYGLGPLLYVTDHWAELITASLAMSFVQACFVYVQSYEKDMMLALGGNTKNPVYNWFIGRSLNPRLGSFDIKTFNELRPGLILWAILDVALIARQYADIGRVTDSILLVVAFHVWYVFDAEYNEAAMLSTMDITTDGFGFMLAVGDLAWVPFTYCYSARCIALNPNDLGVSGVVGVLAVQLVGYWIFRGSNGEKNEFRKGNNPKNRTFLQTERGTKLLTSGWWGMSQHPNYLGDWLMAWAWCLPAGFSTPLPYFYPIYFAVLLVHRQMRDDEACEKKYGKDWATYKKLVPYRIIPYVY
ncbi:C-14 sterol reductase [Pseudohyphozyma bogoriensis]|nr:C-14 sterol reductase [Pseudohyphozyma bogoriensis]